MLEYPVMTIPTRNALDSCPAFHVNHFQWRCVRRPAAWGRMGYLPGEGLLISMSCAEPDPKRTYQSPGDPVCRDSAMEAFFALPDNPAQRGGFQPSDNGLYLNFEVNANGAMYAKYGHGRQGRRFITEEEYRQTGVTARVEPDRWHIGLLVPQALITRLTGIDSLQPGDVLYCNFYKIAEDPAIEHYASFSPIQNETPNFHLPRFFARAVVRPLQP